VQRVLKDLLFRSDVPKPKLLPCPEPEEIDEVEEPNEGSWKSGLKVSK